MWKPTILHFHCHALNTAQKNKLETVQWKKPRKWNVIKDYYWYKQFFQISGLCGPQFLSHLPKHFTHLCRAMNGDAISVDSLAAGNQQKHLEFTFSIKALPFHSSASIRVQKTHLLILYLKWLNCWKSRGMAPFNETAFLFSCHALRKLGSSKWCIFEMKQASGLETCTKIYFLLFFNLV